jgi:hypothetical protein
MLGASAKAWSKAPGSISSSGAPYPGQRARKASSTTMAAPTSL